MPYSVTAFQSTPNPNALKCILDRPLHGPPRSYRAAAEAHADPLAAALFAIPGVTTLLLTSEWITVNKGPDKPWPPIKQAIERTLAAHPA